MKDPSSISVIDNEASHRKISLGDGLATIPERLLLAHARGKVLFVVGAGVSKSAGLPDFRDLVLKVYEQFDSAAYTVMSGMPSQGGNQRNVNESDLTDHQVAEVKRFADGEYDVVLGMLERRIDGQAGSQNQVRSAVASVLRQYGSQPAESHRALMRLADRGGATTIITTNFDLLLEEAAKRKIPNIQTYSLGGIPRPGHHPDFSGVLHIHGALDRNPAKTSDLILTDHDFGEFYLRRGVVPYLIYDAARLFNLVLVGYSANDPPMRYLLNAVAADDTRFTDIKERFVFTGSSDSVELEDWRLRGITPISYDKQDHHRILKDTLTRWADLSAINGNSQRIDAKLKRIIKQNRDSCSESGRDLVDHIIRRASPNERIRLSEFLSKQGADPGWLDAIAAIASGDSVGDSLP